MHRLTLTIGKSKHNSKQGSLLINLQWGPKLNDKVNRLVDSVIHGLDLSSSLKVNLAVIIKNHLIQCLEDTTKHGMSISPKVNLVKLEGEVIRFKLICSIAGRTEVLPLKFT